jgi:hypothetical protein
MCPSHWVEPVFDQKKAREGADDWAAALKQRNAAYQDSVELTEREKTKLIVRDRPVQPQCQTTTPVCWPDNCTVRCVCV